MAIIVQKFGGTSMGSLSRLRKVAERVIAAKRQGDDVIVVVSAMAGETNRLTQLANAVSDNPSSRELASLLTTGEHVAMTLLALRILDQGVDACSYSGLQLPILTSADHANAEIERVETQHIKTALQKGKVVVVGGFQGVASNGEITTLGRGGSDITAVAIAAAMEAKECQIFTDVDGVYTADPRLVPLAQVFQWLSYDQLLAMASIGAKVVQSRAVAMAEANDVTLRVLSSFSDDASVGTLITHASDPHVEKRLHPALAITYQNDARYADISVINLLDSNKINEISGKVEFALKSANVSIAELLEPSDRVCVRIDSALLARSLCVLHSQLGMDVI